MKIYNTIFSTMTVFMLLHLTTYYGFDLVTGFVVSLFGGIVMYAVHYILIAE